MSVASSTSTRMRLPAFLQPSGGGSASLSAPPSTASLDGSVQRYFEEGVSGVTPTPPPPPPSNTQQKSHMLSSAFSSRREPAAQTAQGEKDRVNQVSFGPRGSNLSRGGGSEHTRVSSGVDGDRSTRLSGGGGGGGGGLHPSTPSSASTSPKQKDPFAGAFSRRSGGVKEAEEEGERGEEVLSGRSASVQADFVKATEGSFRGGSQRGGALRPTPPRPPLHNPGETVGADPNNGLPLVQLDGAFAALDGYVVYGLWEVTQVTYKGRYLEGRAVLVTRDGVLLCGADGRVGRFIKMHQIAKLERPASDAVSTQRVGRSNLFVLVVPTEHDLMAQLATSDEYSGFCDVLGRAYKSKMQVSLQVVTHWADLEFEKYNLKRAAQHKEEDTAVQNFEELALGFEELTELQIGQLSRTLHNKDPYDTTTELTTLAQLAQASGGGEAELRATGRHLGMSRQYAAVQLRRSDAAEAERRLDEQMAKLKDDIVNESLRQEENSKRLTLLREKTRDVEGAVVEVAGHMLSEDSAEIYSFKDEKIKELEAELEVRQRHLFESMQSTPNTDLNLRIQETLFNGALPSDVVLPESAALGRMTQQLEQELTERTALKVSLQERIDELSPVEDLFSRKEDQIKWLEHANLLAGLPFLSALGAISGVYGPWPKPVDLSKKRKTGNGAIADDPRPQRSETGTWDVTRGDQDNVVVVNGINMPVQGYNTIDELEVDPRTGLRLVSVPPEYEQTFQDVVGAVVYFFALVRTKTGAGRSHTHKRILVVSDQSLYVCDMDGAIRRCVDIMSLVDCLLDDKTGLGLKVETEHDLFLQFLSIAHREHVVDCIIKVQAYTNEGLHKRMTIRQLALGQKIETKLLLQKQPDWQFRIMPLRTKHEFMDEINEKLLGRKKGTDIVETQDERVQRFWQPVKESMEETHEKEMTDPETELATLRQRAAERSEVVKSVGMELLKLKTQMMEHNCPASNEIDMAHYTKEALAFDPSMSRYAWLPVTPLLIDTGMDVICLAYHSTIVATAHANGWIQLWSTESLQLIGTLRGHTGKVVQLAFHVKVPNADAAAMDITDGRPEDDLSGALLGVDGGRTLQLFSASHDSSIRRWEVAQVDEDGIPLAQSTPDSAALSVLQSHRGHVNCLHLHGTLLCTAGDDTLINIWDISRSPGRESPVMVLKGHKGPVVSVHMDGTFVVSAEWGWILVWDAQEAVVKKTFRDEYGGIRNVSVTRDFIAAVGNSGDINVWNVASGTCKTIQGTGDDILWSQIHGRYIITSGADCKVRAWNAATLEQVSVFHNSFPNEMQNFQFDRFNFIGCEDKYLRMWLK